VLFGTDRYSSAFVVTCWWQPPGSHLPVEWVTRTARTLAGARRIAHSKVIQRGLRRPCTITITEVHLREVEHRA
jgi:hypothetical protein